MKSILQCFFVPIVVSIAMILACAQATDFEIIGHWDGGDSHIFAVYTKVTDIDRMQDFAETMPYVEGKNTTVCFFAEKELTPDFSQLKATSWTTAALSIYKSDDFKNCIAWYDRLSSGDERIVPDPAVHLADGLF